MLHRKGEVLLCVFFFFSVKLGSCTKIWPGTNGDAVSHDKLRRDVASYSFGLNRVISQNASFEKVYSADVRANVIHSFTYTEQTNLVSSFLFGNSRVSHFIASKVFVSIIFGLVADLGHIRLKWS